jgi:hypothetical protein
VAGKSTVLLKSKRLTTQNIMHASCFDLNGRSSKLDQQGFNDEACFERHALYSNVSNNNMTVEQLISNYILNDGQIISLTVDFKEEPSALVTLKARKRNLDNSLLTLW